MIFIKKNCIEELCKKSFENGYSTYKLKRIISGFIKTLQIKLLHSSFIYLPGPILDQSSIWLLDAAIVILMKNVLFFSKAIDFQGFFGKICI